MDQSPVTYGIHKPGAAEIARYAHPEDPRVMRTAMREIFTAAAMGHDQYRAAILQRGEAFKEHMAGQFQTVANTLKPEFIILDADAQDGKAVIKTPSLEEFEFFELVEPELTSMATLYNRLTGISEISMTLSRMVLTRTMHPHDFPVLNCNWLSKGTAWKNLLKQGLYAERGDLLFMKPNFYHTASFEKDDEFESPRMLIAVMPREFSY